MLTEKKKLGDCAKNTAVVASTGSKKIETKFLDAVA